MKISAGQRRAIGASGVEVPPIVFGTSALANIPDVIPEQRKLAICGEWFRYVEPPVFVDVDYKHGDGQALEVLGRMLRKLDVAGDEVALLLTIDGGRSPAAGAAPGDNLVVDCWEKSCHFLGDVYRPKLVSVVNAKDCVWRAVSELKAAGVVRGVGIVVNDCRAPNRLAAAVDWVELAGGFTLMRHPSEVLTVMSDLAGRQIPIVVSGVFGGGFLVGGNRLDGLVVSADEPANRTILAWRTVFAALCHGHGVTPAHACVQFALSAPGVVAVKLNSSYPDRVAANVDSVLRKVPDRFWESMKEEGLLSEDYSYL